ncbi:SWI/SNF complex subunit SMARCC1 isoform X2 [Toxorhynchites rutilus septentrionalis]|uniref:SWI/SNF complex subunit SMARCC1 isoform X2 n=1 Tax=Toxorhynchites rutilus septentrionalis TaxID=329112 RepID=UPI002478F999|nr:SWI/SNF complex subunit SMARCC1 isoform X2 [Toxorhynchites rutilus septentrionalis]
MVSLGPKKDGGPNAEFFTSPESLQGFETVRQWLQKNLKKYLAPDPPTKESLAHLIIQFVQYQETKLGKCSQDPPTTRLPMRCFMDFKPGGSLCHILATMYRYKAEQRWRKFDFTVNRNPMRKDPIIQMLLDMETALIEAECMRLPIVYVRPEVDKQTANRITDIVTNHQGEMTLDEEEATHIIYPAVDPLPEDYARPTFRRDKHVMIHWYYFPESYDTWIPNTFDLPDNVPDYPLSPGDRWRVSASWVTDLEEYNEWMPEEDYEVDEAGRKKLHKLRLGVEDLMAGSGDDKVRRTKVIHQKRKRSPSPQAKGGKRKSGRSPAVFHKKTRADDEDSEDMTKDMDDPQPETNLTEVKASSSNSASGPATPQPKRDPEMMPLKYATMTDLDDDIDRANADRGDDSQAGKTSDNSNTQEFPHGKDDLEDNVTEQAHHIIVPSYSAWFDYNSIHVVEKRALPEFFNGKNKSKTPEIYLAYRNFMIDTYRLNPTEYLTSTACRRNLAGDVCAIMRVHAFLEQWGLINYQIDADSRPTPMGPPPTSHFHVLSDTPSGLQPLNAPKTAQPSAAKNLLDLDKKVDKKDDLAASALGISAGASSSSADGIKTEPGTITADPNGQFGLRLDQYAKKPSAMRNKTAASMSRDWTEQETLLLLEGLEMYKDDWNKVCEHVGSRTQDECILHFLRLPIEDPYLEDDNTYLGPLSYQPIPFSKAGNPIMSTVAFLASVVDPRIAASAAKAAMEEFAAIKDEVPASMMDSHLKNVEKTSFGGKFDPYAGLTTSGIAGTEPDKDKEDDDNKLPGASSGQAVSSAPGSTDVDMKDLSKKDDDKETDKSVEKPFSTTEGTKTSDSDAAVGGDQQKTDGTEDEKNKDKEVSTDLVKENGDPKVFNEGNLQAAAAAALAAAAVKAKHLAAVEERKIKSLVALLVETQMKKLEIKLRHFEELETTMEREREGLEYQRQQLIQERQQFHLEQLKAAEFRARQQAHQRFQLEQGQWQQPTMGGATGIPPQGGIVPPQQQLGVPPGPGQGPHPAPGSNPQQQPSMQSTGGLPGIPVPTSINAPSSNGIMSASPTTIPSDGSTQNNIMSPTVPGQPPSSQHTQGPPPPQLQQQVMPSHPGHSTGAPMPGGVPGPHQHPPPPVPQQQPPPPSPQQAPLAPTQGPPLPTQAGPGGAIPGPQQGPPTSVGSGPIPPSSS